VAVGGRGTLVGAIIGSWLINAGKSWLTVALPSAWLYVLGALFVAITLLVPDGLMGLGAFVRARLRARRPPLAK
jgi:urea transport system permease protein